MYFLISVAARSLLLRVIILSDITVQTTNGQRNSPNYFGCFKDDNDNRIMGGPQSVQGVKYDTCLSHCQKHRTTYFGLQFGGECYCSNTFGGLGVLDETDCNTKCSADDSQWCGGANAMDVYSVGLPKNLAIHRPTWQSSTFVETYWFSSDKPLPSQLAVDGNKDSNLGGGSCMHTTYEKNPWWAVDLGNRTRIRAIALTNRGDCCGDRTSNFIVGLSNTSPNESTPTPGQYTVCGRGPITSQRGGAMYYVRCTYNQLPARYVIIQLPRIDNLNFCELEVYGEVVDACHINKGNCSDICTTTDDGRMCSCYAGYTLNADGLSCMDTDECTEAARNGGCSHICLNTFGSYRCDCRGGFNLSEDNMNCTDFNECSVNNGSCSHECINTQGSYHCSCPDEHVLQSDKLTCTIKERLHTATLPSVLISIIVVVIVLLAGLAAILFLLFVRRHRRNELHAGTSSISMDGESDCSSDKIIYEETTYSTMSTATGVKWPQLEEHIKLLGETDGFRQQFAQLPRDDLMKCTVGKQPQYKKKNRFVNILPYDATRVTLRTRGEKNSDDGYINASYITKYTGTDVTYIATQAPKLETVDDFWWMIWQENIRCITALVLLFEGGKPRCHKYWPDIVGDSSEFGEITVKLDELDTFAEYTRRTMSVQIKGASPRKVIQLQYRVWPDKSIPEDLWSLLAFHRRVRSTSKSVSSGGGPLLVHCSAGVGRTGTFIALDMLMEEVKQTGKVDVFGVVKHLRLQRMSSVQVKDQYTLLFDLLLDLYKTGETSITKSGALEIDENAQKEKLETEFKRLNALKPTHSVSDDSEALQPLNLAKNRHSDFVPPNKLRVILPPRSNGSDYINAASATGFKTPAFYILTQLPLANTVDDFWQLIVAENVSSIVMLDAVTPVDKTTVEFWPKVVGKSTAYGQVHVTLNSSQPEPASGIILHSLEVTGKQSGKTSKLAVRIHELATWTRDCDTPDNVDDFLQLIHLVTEWEFQQMKQQRQYKRTPSTATSSKDSCQLRHVAVMCLDGATRSGLYAATSLTVDRLKCDDELDVLPSCRYITAARPQAIASLKQYEFVYQAALRFMNWTPDQWTSVNGQLSSDPVYGNVDRSGDDLGGNIYANAPSTGRSGDMSLPGNDDERVYANY